MSERIQPHEESAFLEEDIGNLVHIILGELGHRNANFSDSEMDISCFPEETRTALTIALGKYYQRIREYDEAISLYQSVGANDALNEMVDSFIAHYSDKHYLEFDPDFKLVDRVCAITGRKLTSDELIRIGNYHMRTAFLLHPRTGTKNSKVLDCPSKDGTSVAEECYNRAEHKEGIRGLAENFFRLGTLYHDDDHIRKRLWSIKEAIRLSLQLNDEERLMKIRDICIKFGILREAMDISQRLGIMMSRTELNQIGMKNLSRHIRLKGQFDRAGREEYDSDSQQSLAIAQEAYKRATNVTMLRFITTQIVPYSTPKGT